MKKQMIILAVSFISALLAAAEVEIGKPAPDFTAKDIQGQTQYYQIFFNHRFVFVMASDVDVLHQ